MAASAGDMLLMSGGWPPVAPLANGAAPRSAVCCGGALSCAERPKRWPAINAMSATSAIAATAHGRAEEKLRCSPGPSAPAAVPQRWQNLAPGRSAAPHAAQVVAASVAPQFE